VAALGTYQFEYNSDLGASGWQSAGEPVQAEGTMLRLIDAAPPDPKRFYRLQRLGP
jgi:hypothetical protein